jgi:hypothetical protein
MDLSQALTGIFGITTILATAVAGLVWGTVKTVRDTASDLRGRVGDLETERAKDKALIAELRTENTVLTKTVTGEVHWVALTALLTLHHKESGERLEKVLAILDQVLSILNQVLSALNRGKP